MSADRPMIEVAKPLHTELKAVASKRDYRLTHLVSALLRYGLDDLQKGFVDLAPPTIKTVKKKAKKAKN